MLMLMSMLKQSSFLFHVVISFPLTVNTLHHNQQVL